METGVVCGLFDVLSDRELEVLAIVAEDKTDREIAGRLAISERTVRAHVSRIIRKLGVASRVGAAVVFVAFGSRDVECAVAGTGLSLVVRSHR